jgi:RNA polymerase sigma-70 factor (ECF subfamily)
MAEDMMWPLKPNQNERRSSSIEGDDSELLDRLRKHDPAAFMVLYDGYNRQVFRFLLHMTGSVHEAEELLQSVFVTVWEGVVAGMFERFEVSRGTLEGYLMGIARNAARKLIARNSRIVSVDQFESSHGAIELSTVDSGFVAIEKESELRRMHEAIVQLPVEFREAIVLCCLQDFSYEQAAKVMNCSIGTVGSRVNRGKALLRKALLVPCNIRHVRSVAEAR